jgi:hypothetical protein
MFALRSLSGDTRTLNNPNTKSQLLRWQKLATPPRDQREDKLATVARWRPSSLSMPPPTLQ